MGSHEARALWDEVSSAILVGFEKLIVGANNKIIIEALEGNIQVPYPIANILHDIQAWVAQANHIFREAKNDSKLVIKVGSFHYEVFAFKFMIFPCPRSILYNDFVRRILVRMGV